MEDIEKLHSLLITPTDSLSVKEITDYIRGLRNLCASSDVEQTRLGQNNKLLEDIDNTISVALKQEKCEEWLQCLRVSTQFLGNLVVMNPVNKNIVWTQFNLHLRKMIQYGDRRLKNHCLMVVYNIMLDWPLLTKDLFNEEEFNNVMLVGGFEYSEYIIERMFTQDIDWTKVYNSNINIEGRLFFLDMLERTVNEKRTDEDVVIAASLVAHLASQFCLLSDSILRTVADQVDQLHPQEVTLLLQILTSFSADSPHLPVLQDKKSFFLNCAFLLKSIQMAGKEPGSVFTPVTKLGDHHQQDVDDEPTFAFKGRLVRLLGNLCYKHRHNQDLIRELEIIPVLLDCCNIDARNPFIVQGVIFVMRIICDSNPANQAVIAGLNRQGVVQPELLTELGLTLYAEGENQLRIAPLKTSSGFNSEDSKEKGGPTS